MLNSLEPCFQPIIGVSMLSVKSLEEKTALVSPQIQSRFVVAGVGRVVAQC